MALNNMISIAFTDSEMQILDQAHAMIMGVMKGKGAQLTPKESQRYGKLGNESENWMEMVFKDCQLMPSLLPSFVDAAEFAKDEAARKIMSPRISQLEAVVTTFADTNRLVGFDLYQTCLSIYNYVKYLSKQDVPGTKSIYEKWSVQFPGRPAAVSNPTPPPPVS